MPRHRDPLSGSAGAPPVVCLHGLFESPAIWRPVRRKLARAGRRSFALPLPGHRRDAPGDTRTRDILAGCGLVEYLAARIARKAEGGPVYLLGHSMGGLLALLVARARPSLVARVMVVSAPHAGHAGRSDWLDPRVLADIPYVSHVSARILLAFWLSDPVRFEAGLRDAIAPGERLEWIPETMRHELRSGCASAIHQMSVWLRGQDALASFEAVTVPVSVLVSAQDPVVAPGHQMEIVRALPNATAQVVRCGHLPMLTAPDLFERAVLHWALPLADAPSPGDPPCPPGIEETAQMAGMPEPTTPEHVHA